MKPTKCKINNFRVAAALVMSLATTTAAAGEWGMGFDFYGRSYHHDLPPGQRDKHNEANLGFGIHGARTEGRHRFVVETGAFENSAYDQAYWVGGQYTYRLARHLEAGLMVRHWETAHGTYPEKPLNKYATFSVPLTDRFRLSFIVRSSGYIAFASYDLKASAR